MVSRALQITNTSKQKVIYTDFTRNLDLNLISGELQILTNANAVINSVENLVMTYPTERFYHPEIGTQIFKNLFDLFNYHPEFSADTIQEQVVSLLSVHEPRVNGVKIQVTPHMADNYYKVNITFNIINIPNQVFALPLVIPVR
jgi:phage baseplate assembly protein W